MLSYHAPSATEYGRSPHQPYRNSENPKLDFSRNRAEGGDILGEYWLTPRTVGIQHPPEPSPNNIIDGIVAISTNSTASFRKRIKKHFRINGSGEITMRSTIISSKRDAGASQRE